MADLPPPITTTSFGFSLESGAVAARKSCNRGPNSDEWMIIPSNAPSEAAAGESSLGTEAWLHPFVNTKYVTISQSMEEHE